MLLSLAFKPPEGWTIAPTRPVTGSVPVGLKLLINPNLVVKGLSFE